MDELALTIRPYQPRWWEDLCAVHDPARRLELERAGLPEAFLPLTVAAEAEDLFGYPHLDVALLGDRAVGFCAYTEEELAWLYVRPDLHRRGIGRALARRALERAPSISCLEVLWGNGPAKGLYETLGFSVAEVVTGRMPGNESFQVRVYRMSREI